MIVSDTVAAISNSDAPAIAMVLQTSINMAQATAINTYMHALEVNGPAVDSATAATLYIAGKLTSGSIAKQKQTLRWLVNWASIGVVDGYFTHSWYHFIQGAVTDWNLNLDHVSETFLLTSISSLVYTPIYCATFLALLSIVEVIISAMKVVNILEMGACFNRYIRSRC